MLPSIVLDFVHFVDVQSIEQNLLLALEFLARQAVFIDIDEAMVVFLEFGAHIPRLHVDDEQIPVVVGKFLCAGSTFRCGHESEHLEEIALLEQAKIPLLDLGTPVQGHARQVILGLFQVATIEFLDGVVYFVERKDAGLELLGRFEGAKH